MVVRSDYGVLRENAEATEDAGVAGVAADVVEAGVAAETDQIGGPFPECGFERREGVVKAVERDR